MLDAADDGRVRLAQGGRERVRRMACSATAQLGCVWPGSEPPPIADRVVNGFAAHRACGQRARAGVQADGSVAAIMRHTGTSRSASPRT